MLISRDPLDDDDDDDNDDDDDDDDDVDDLYIIGAVWHEKADSPSYLFYHGGWWDL